MNLGPWGKMFGYIVGLGAVYVGRIKLFVRGILWLCAHVFGGTSDAWLHVNCRQVCLCGASEVIKLWLDRRNLM